VFESNVVLPIALGVALATAVGFRTFLPLLVVSIAAYNGYLTLSSNFVWLGTLPAMVMLGVAAAVEVLAYYVPAVDHLLDVAVTPIALLAGTVVSAAVMTDLPPMVKWATAIIVGGSAAGLTKGATILLRAKSTALTAGLGNPVVATAETTGAVVISVLALVVPLVAVIVALLLCGLAVRVLRRLLGKRAARRREDHPLIRSDVPERPSIHHDARSPK
jgi:Domain of unknown function (DUF4126)